MDDREKGELLDAMSLAISALALATPDPDQLRAFLERVDRVLEFPDAKPAVRELFARLRLQIGGVVAQYDAHAAAHGGD